MYDKTEMEDEGEKVLVEKEIDRSNGVSPGK